MMIELEELEVAMDELLELVTVDELLELGTIDELLELGAMEELLELGAMDELLVLGITDELLELGTTDELLELGITDELLELGRPDEVLELGITDELLELGTAEQLLVKIKLDAVDRVVESLEKNELVVNDEYVSTELALVVYTDDEVENSELSDTSEDVTDVLETELTTTEDGPSSGHDTS